jgi:hypothetical protein
MRRAVPLGLVAVPAVATLAVAAVALTPGIAAGSGPAAGPPDVVLRAPSGVAQLMGARVAPPGGPPQAAPPSREDAQQTKAAQQPTGTDVVSAQEATSDQAVVTGTTAAVGQAPADRDCGARGARAPPASGSGTSA